MAVVNTKDLEGAALDWAVAKSEAKENVKIEQCRGADTPAFCVVLTNGVHWTPLTDWSQGGPLIAKHDIEFVCIRGELAAFVSSSAYERGDPDAYGPDHLIAACRAIVADKMGDVIQVPDELTPT